MKKIIKSLIVLVLLSITLFLSACQIDNIGSYNRGHWAYSKKESKFVNKIEVDWDSGDVTINFVDETMGDGIEVLCLSNMSQHETVHKIENNTLKIYFCSHKFHIGHQKSKWLEINVPKSLVSLKDIEVDNASGLVEMNDLSLDKVSIELASGDIKINNCNLNELHAESVSSNMEISSSIINKMDIENVSGKVNANGTFNVIDLETVSGEVKIDSNICPSKIDLEAVSSNVIITIPDNDGFEVELDSVSATLEIEFEVYVNETWNYKNGVNKFNFDVVSSDIKINKKYN